MAGLQLTDALQKAQDYAKSLGLQLTSGFRQGSTGPSGKPDSHSKGMAMDFSGSKDQMSAYADWAKKSGYFTEVLYNTADHYDHVHVGWETGKHQDGMMYVGDHTLIPIPKAGADVPSGTATNRGSSTDKGMIGKAFTGIIRAVILIVFLILAIYFLFQAFPDLKVSIPI